MIKQLITLSALVLVSASPLVAEHKKNASDRSELTLIIPVMNADAAAMREFQRARPLEELPNRFVQYGIQYILPDHESARLWTISAGLSDMTKRAVGLSVETTW